jgi:hypothetical protein
MGLQGGDERIAVIESGGAESFRGRKKTSMESRYSEDILDYDRRITEYAMCSLKEKTDILTVHMRTLDRFSHRAKNWEELKSAAKEMDENLGNIFRNSEKCLFFSYAEIT